MDVPSRLALVKEVGEEIVTEEELRALLEAKAHPVAYDGFEPSGTAHVAQGVMRAINVNKMTRAGFRFKMFVADWHAWANNKMGGDLEKIQTTGKYLIETWRATGMDLSKVDFVWASDLVKDEDYWKKVMNVARDSSLDRVLRTTQIMGRSDKDKLSAAQILYPCMQAADIFHLGADVTQLGMDQRKVNMLAREVGPKLGFWKPVVVSHHMLMGLAQPAPPTPVAKTLKSVTAAFWGPSTVRRIESLRQLKQESATFLANLARTIEEQKSLDAAQTALMAADGTLRTIIERKQAEPEPVRDFDLFNDYVAIRESLKDVENRLRRAQEEETIARATAQKMSKSNPDTAIFMTDTREQVAAKIKKAYCPSPDPENKEAENPILEYYKYIIFPARGSIPIAQYKTVLIERPAKFGGDLEFASYAELESAFVEGKLHPMDAKAGAAKYVNLLLDPVREHFEKDPAARRLKEQVDAFKVTR